MSSIASRCILLITACLVLPAVTAAHDGHRKPAGEVPACAGHGLDCATTVSPAFAADGKLWLVWAANERISIASSSDGGKTLALPVTLPKTELPLDNGPDARPRIVVGAKGELYVSFASRDEKYNGHAFLTRSLDGGRTFAAPLPIASDSPSQRFETVAIDREGRAFAAWIDKRNAAAAREAKTPYAGAALAFGWSDATTGAIATPTIAKDNTCECCRIAVAFAAPQRPVVLFRNIFPGSVRDHGIITFADAGKPGPVFRVSDDDAVTESCPHHGPSLAIAGDGSYHATWAAVGRKLKGVYYARSTDAGRSFSAPLRLGEAEAQVSRPFVLASGNTVYLVYKTFDGTRTRVALMTSADAGATWSAPRTIAETGNDSDHPLLVTDGRVVSLSWLTRAEGFRLIALEPAP